MAVLERIPEQDIPWTLDKLFGHADKLLCLVVARYRIVLIATVHRIDSHQAESCWYWHNSLCA